MDDSSSFNKLWVIESLPDGDLKTGTLLVENQLQDAKQKHKELFVDFEQTTTCSGLIL